METTFLDVAAREVLGNYALILCQGGLLPLGNHGGFSGAQLWRVERAGQQFCLRAWPVGEPSPERLNGIHRWMHRAREAGLQCVPAVLPTRTGRTWVSHVDRLWELSTWMPGRADFRERPGRDRLEQVCTTLAHLHRAWAGESPAFGPCPALGRRLVCADEWIRLIGAGWDLPPAGPADRADVRHWVERAWRVVRRRVMDIPSQLAPWFGQPFPLQPCLCDIRQDHLLFQGEKITGLIDFGAARVDHVAVDLARLLGSMAGDDGEQRAAGLRAYSRYRTLTSEEERLVAVLDETGTVLGAANWLKWLYWEKRCYEDWSAVTGRLAELVERLEKWSP